jgi:hypothetical protein
MEKTEKRRLSSTDQPRKMVHLADLEHPRLTLCGVPLSTAELGVYVEELAGRQTHDEEGTWSRRIYPSAGVDAQACAACLLRKKPVLCLTPNLPYLPEQTPSRHA